MSRSAVPDTATLDIFANPEAAAMEDDEVVLQVEKRVAGDNVANNKRNLFLKNSVRSNLGAGQPKQMNFLLNHFLKLIATPILLVPFYSLSFQGSMSAPSVPGGTSSASSSSGLPIPGSNTLDEPIRETILRDVRAVGQKFAHVMYPVEKKSLLRVRQ
jgi:hypothetical protein